MTTSQTFRKIFAGLFLATIFQLTFAESPDPDVTASGDTITARHRYTMGDNDSKSDATTICFLEAKRKAIEYAGVYVESTFQIYETEKSRKATSDVKTIAASLVSAEMVSSKQGFDNGRSFVDCVVNAKIDKSKLKENIAKISSDPEMRKQVEKQQNQLKKLETEVLRLQTQLQSAPRQEAILLRQDRIAVFKEIDTLQQKKLEIISLIQSKGHDAQNLITKDMTTKEVRALLGSERASNSEVVQYRLPDGRTETYARYGFNYGTHWVFFRNDLVICVSRSANGC